MALTSVRKLIVPETAYGVCLWETESGYLSDGDGYLSLEGRVGDKSVEAKMREAANYWMSGNLTGSPKWIHGARKITDDEYDDQQSRLLSGEIPDEVEAARQSLLRGK